MTAILECQIAKKNQNGFIQQEVPKALNRSLEYTGQNKTFNFKI